MKPMIIAGNWKMNTVPEEAESLAKGILNGLKNKKIHSKVVVCPPFIDIPYTELVLRGSGIEVGAQNCYHKPSGAYTGETSIPMIKAVGCKYIIIGHSERRIIFCETDETINTKAKAILESGLIPIICIGEVLEEREAGKTFEILEKQLLTDLKDIDEDYCDNIVIAYEPVWAIGTGVTASSEQIDEAHNFIRSKLIQILGKKAGHIAILYGGSVNAQNSLSILDVANVNGALIGGASLKADSFLSIIDDAERVLKGLE